MFEGEPVNPGDSQGDPVEPPRLVGSAVLLHPGAGEAFDAVELFAVDRSERAAEASRTAGLDLAEDDRIRASGDQVELADAVAPVAGEDLHPVAAEVGGGEAFAEAAELVRRQAAQIGAEADWGRWRRVWAGGCRGGHRGSPVASSRVVVAIGVVADSGCVASASGRPGRGRRRTFPLPKRSIGSR